MGRYANRFITLNFPELSEEGDPIFVKIRNPKTMAAQDLTPDGIDAETDPNSQQAADATYKVVAGLITDWHVYDATSDDDDLPPLPLPATTDSIKLLPAEILTRIAEEIGKVTANPTKQPTPTAPGTAS